MNVLAPKYLVGLAMAAIGSALAIGISANTTLPDGPCQIVWDRQPCAFCCMHVGEPGFAAQVQTTAGRTLAFDDPGCLFVHAQQEGVSAHATYIRHFREDRWIRSDAVAFVDVHPTPMGYGIGAVDAGTKGSFSLREARRRSLAWHSCLNPRIR